MTDIELKDDAEIVRENYNKNAEKEWQRLEGFSFEFEITKRFLKKHMHGKTVLDIGGGPGRYSIYLAQQGFDVTMVDLSENNIAIAKEKFSQYGVNVKAYVCDARNLSCLNLGKFDNVLLMDLCITLQSKRIGRHAYFRRNNIFPKTAFCSPLS